MAKQFCCNKQTILTKIIVYEFYFYMLSFTYFGYANAKKHLVKQDFFPASGACGDIYIKGHHCQS